MLGDDSRRSNAGSGSPVVLARGRAPTARGVVMRPTTASPLGMARRRWLAEVLSRTYVVQADLPGERTERDGPDATVRLDRT